MMIRWNWGQSSRVFRLVRTRLFEIDIESNLDAQFGGTSLFRGAKQFCINLQIPCRNGAFLKVIESRRRGLSEIYRRLSRLEISLGCSQSTCQRASSPKQIRYCTYGSRYGQSTRWRWTSQLSHKGNREVRQYCGQIAPRIAIWFALVTLYPRLRSPIPSYISLHLSIAIYLLPFSPSFSSSSSSSSSSHGFPMFHW